MLVLRVYRLSCIMLGVANPRDAVLLFELKNLNRFRFDSFAVNRGEKMVQSMDSYLAGYML